MIANCIGYNNQLIYTLFLVVSILYYTFLFFAIAYSVFNMNTGIPLSPFVLFVYYFCVEHTFITLSAFITLALIGFTGYLLYAHMKHVLANTTSYEEVAWRRYSLLQSPSDSNKRVNPFNLGSWKANLKEYIFGGRNWYTFYWNQLIPENSNTYELNSKIINHEDFDEEEFESHLGLEAVKKDNGSHSHNHSHDHNHGSNPTFSIV